METRDLTYVKTITKGEDRKVEVLMAHDGTLYVRKTIKRLPGSKWMQAKRELQLARDLSAITGVVPVIQTAVHADWIHIYTEFWEGGDLHEYVQSRILSLDEACRLFFVMVVTVTRVHLEGVAHRDLKMENWLLRFTPEGFMEIGLTDFGLSVATTGLQTTSVGTLCYASPELLDRHRTSYDPFLADAWALGVCFYAMVCHQFPFYAEQPVDTIDQIIGQQLSIPLKATLTFPSAVCGILRGLLCKNPQQRMSVFDILQKQYLRSLVPSALVREADRLLHIPRKSKPDVDVDLTPPISPTSSTSSMNAEENLVPVLNMPVSVSVPPSQRRRRFSPRELSPRAIFNHIAEIVGNH